jgi:hypothetical protein
MHCCIACKLPLVLSNGGVHDSLAIQDGPERALLRSANVTASDVAACLLDRLTVAEQASSDTRWHIHNINCDCAELQSPSKEVARLSLSLQPKGSRDSGAGSIGKFILM